MNKIQNIAAVDIKIGDQVILAGDDSWEYSTYTVPKIDGSQATLEGQSGQFSIIRLRVIDQTKNQVII